MPKRKQPTTPTTSDPWAKTRAKTDRIIAESQARAAHFLKTAPRCDVCGSQIASPGRKRHYTCEPDYQWPEGTGPHV